MQVEAKPHPIIDSHKKPMFTRSAKEVKPPTAQKKKKLVEVSPQKDLKAQTTVNFQAGAYDSADFRPPMTQAQFDLEKQKMKQKIMNRNQVVSFDAQQQPSRLSHSSSQQPLPSSSQFLTEKRLKDQEARVKRQKERDDGKCKAEQLKVDRLDRLDRLINQEMSLALESQANIMQNCLK